MHKRFDKEEDIDRAKVNVFYVCCAPLALIVLYRSG